MFCRNCGAQIQDGSVNCPYCGAQQYNQQPYQQPYQQNYQQPYQQSGIQNTLPMNWHKFLACFALWISAVGFIGIAILYFTGNIYGSGNYFVMPEHYKDRMYEYISGLQTMDIFYGAMLLAIGAFGFYVAYSLLKLKRGAPKLLAISYLAAAGASVLYFLIASILIISKTDMDTYFKLFELEGLGRGVLSAFSLFISSIVMLFINRAYYKKREHLFVN